MRPDDGFALMECGGRHTGRQPPAAVYPTPGFTRPAAGPEPRLAPADAVDSASDVVADEDVTARPHGHIRGSGKAGHEGRGHADIGPACGRESRAQQIVRVRAAANARSPGRDEDVALEIPRLWAGVERQTDGCGVGRDLKHRTACDVAIRRRAPHAGVPVVRALDHVIEFVRRIVDCAAARVGTVVRTKQVAIRCESEVVWVAKARGELLQTGAVETGSQDRGGPPALRNLVAVAGAAGRDIQQAIRTNGDTIVAVKWQTRI